MLNIDKLGVNLAVDTVVAIVRSTEINAYSLDSMVTLSKLALASRSKAAIVESGLSYGQSTAVSVSVKEPGKVTLTGVVENEKGRIRAEGVVRGVKGVEAVDNRIRVRPDDRHA